MSSDKVRAEFEAWANRFFANAPTNYKRDALPKDDPNYGDYVAKPLQVAWVAWQASRAAPDVAGLVEALKKARDAVGSLPQDALGNVPDTRQSQGWHIRDELINEISTALAAYRNQGGES